MKYSTKLAAIILAGSFAFNATSANASGFYLKEQSVTAQGNAFAGATAGADNISYMFFNPAAITKHNGNNVVVGATFIGGDSEIINSSDATTNGQDILPNAIVPNAYFSHQINDKSYIGLSINAPFGLISDYDDFGYDGASHGVKSELITKTITTTYGYKYNDKLSFGAGFKVQQANAQLTQTAAGQASILEGDNVGYGWNVGTLYQVTEKTRLGASYLSSVKHKLKGTMKSDLIAPLNYDISAKLETPDVFSVGVYHDINSKWAVMAEYQKTYWKKFNELRIKDTSGIRPDSVTPENWKDVGFYSLGLTHKYDDKWTFRYGVAFDQGAVNDANRTVRVPDADRTWLSTGASYKVNEGFTISGAYTYIIGDYAEVDHGDYSAGYDTQIHLVGIEGNWNF